MSKGKLYVRLELAWWFAPYVNTLLFLAWIFDAELDMEKLERVIARALRVKNV